MQKAILLAWIIAAATMVWGNFVALLQEDLKRLLAYSSIAHAGYMMVGVAAAFANDRSRQLVLRQRKHLFLSCRLRFHDARHVRSDQRTHDQGSTCGVRRRARWFGLVAALTGPRAVDLPVEPKRHPSTGRFLGQVRDLRRGFGRSATVMRIGSFLLLAVIGMLSAAVGAYYYLRLVVVMYFRPAGDPIEVRGGWPVAYAVGSCVSLTVILGLFSTPLAEAAARPPNRPWPTRIPAWPWLSVSRNRQRFDHFVRNAIDRTTAASVSWGS